MKDRLQNGRIEQVSLNLILIINLLTVRSECLFIFVYPQTSVPRMHVPAPDLEKVNRDCLVTYFSRIPTRVYDAFQSLEV